MSISSCKLEYKKSKSSIGYKTKRGDIYLLCPFHKERTPSCVIHARTPKYFICYGCGKCGKSGWVYSLLGSKRPSYVNSEQFELDNLAFPFYYSLNQVASVADLDVDRLPF